ncbi:hypothetical protein [Edaphobacter bradus]|uniref:hypothetical protein n=1 Tax=Edaphobacter bradus TaxID=2259016 RepID=UPI0021E09164|nr:hypothetical protein [Edaphobacter bradus]
MTVTRGRFPWRLVGMMVALLAGTLAWGQTPESGQAAGEAAGQSLPAGSEERPLPDVAALMHAVETNQRTSEAVLKDYLYREVVTEEKDDSHGAAKKTQSNEYDIFWLNGVQVHKLVKKDGKELTAEEQKKQDEEIDKQVAKAKERRSKADAKGEETDSHGNEEVTVSRLLTLGSFSNPRRVTMDGRDTITVDFVGDPKAKTRNRTEELIRDLAGTVWIDEQDRTIARVEGRFEKAFKIGAGMLVNIKQGTTFSFEQKKVNGEAWLPVRWDGEGAVRAMLFFNFNGKVRGVDSDYRKFKATATILPGIGKVEPGEEALPQ